jgi:hypothetical protein
MAMMRVMMVSAPITAAMVLAIFRHKRIQATELTIDSAVYACPMLRYPCIE